MYLLFNVLVANIANKKVYGQHFREYCQRNPVGIGNNFVLLGFIDVFAVENFQKGVKRKCSRNKEQ